MPLNLDLRLDERHADRVVVSVRVAPDGPTQRVDGVALQLCTREGEPLGPRMLLPICGCLGSALVTRVELKALEPIPPDGQVVAMAWWGAEQIEVRCPSEVGTSLEAHMRGRRQLPLAQKVAVGRLSGEERLVLVRRMPWIAEPLVAAGLEPLETEATVDEICEELGLDGEDAEWLKDLLEEDETAL